MSVQCSFLFLQGMATQFFGRLGWELAKRGYRVNRINFNGGDWFFWPLTGAADYREGMDRWPEYLETHLVKWSVTDIVLFGDCRPLHREAIRVAMLRGVRVHVFDEGYIRPNWVTLEQGGVNGNSSLPRDPDWFRNAVADTPAWDGGLPVSGSFIRRAVEDVIYNVANVLLTWRYPGYTTHRPWHPFVEYAGWLRRFARKPRAKNRIRQGLDRIASCGRDYFFFPLQLDCDSQIRQHSSFGRIAPAIDHVITSFARRAPADSLLVIKEHPLDNAITDWRATVARVAQAVGVSDRLVYLEGGSLERLLEKCRGVVTVNSTVGFLALAFNRPVIALGEAIYDVPDLTFQDDLDDFWERGAPPDPATFDAFRRVAVARTQVNGGFFSGNGLELAVSGSIARFESVLQERGSPAYSAVAEDVRREEMDDLRAASLVL